MRFCVKLPAFPRNTSRHDPEDLNPHVYSCENLESHIAVARSLKLCVFQQKCLARTLLIQGIGTVQDVLCRSQEYEKSIRFNRFNKVTPLLITPDYLFQVDQGNTLSVKNVRGTLPFCSLEGLSSRSMLELLILSAARNWMLLQSTVGTGVNELGVKVQ